MLKTLSIFALASAAVYAAAASTPAYDAPEYVIRATDSAGNVYIAGSGDDCVSAWESAHVPADWRDIICIQVSR